MNIKKIQINKNILSNIKKRENFPFLIRQLGYKRICEVGVESGLFLFYLSLSEPEHLVAVDVWDKYFNQAFVDIPAYFTFYKEEQQKKNREKVQEWASQRHGKTDIIVNFSVEASRQFNDGYFDFVYIDADHSYNGVTADLKAWYPKVREGGILAGHDYINWDKNWAAS